MRDLLAREHLLRNSFLRICDSFGYICMWSGVGFLCGYTLLCSLDLFCSPWVLLLSSLGLLSRLLCLLLLGCLCLLLGRLLQILLGLRCCFGRLLPHIFLGPISFLAQERFRCFVEVLLSSLLRMGLAGLKKLDTLRKQIFLHTRD